MLLDLGLAALLVLAAVGVVAVGRVHNPMVTINERNSSNVTVSESPDDSFNNWNERGRTVFQVNTHPQKERKSQMESPV